MPSKHPPPGEQPAKLPDDLEENPGIGQSKGLFGRTSQKDLDLVEGESTIEGDVENAAPVEKDSAPDDLGRTND